MPALENLANPDMLHAIWLTVLIALITAGEPGVRYAAGLAGDAL
jgi:ABC-type sulfate transport system permease subunit